MREMINNLIERNARMFSMGTLIMSSAVFLICFSFCVSLWRMPDELRGGLDSWGVGLAVQNNRIQKDYAKIIDRMDEIEEDLLYLEVFLFEKQINAQIDKDERNIREKIMKIESDRKERLNNVPQ